MARLREDQKKSLIGGLNISLRWRDTRRHGNCPEDPAPADEIPLCQHFLGEVDILEAAGFVPQLGEHGEGVVQLVRKWRRQWAAKAIPKEWWLESCIDNPHKEWVEHFERHTDGKPRNRSSPTVGELIAAWRHSGQRDMLRGLGWEVVTAGEGREPLGFRRRGPDFVGQEQDIVDLSQAEKDRILKVLHFTLAMGVGWYVYCEPSKDTYHWRFRLYPEGLGDFV